MGIVGAIDILDSAKNITPDQLKLIQIARNCANNLLGIINDVLDFSKVPITMILITILWYYATGFKFERNNANNSLTLVANFSCGEFNRFNFRLKQI